MYGPIWWNGLHKTFEIATHPYWNHKQFNWALVMVGRDYHQKNLQQQELQFDAIHVGAAAAEFPEPLLMQLKVGGVLIIPVGPEKSIQTLYRVVRVQQQQQQQQQQQSLSSSPSFRREDFLFQELFGVRYVPLIHP